MNNLEDQKKEPNSLNSNRAEEPIHQIDPLIAKLVYYSNFFERVKKIPYISKLMYMLNFLNFRLGSKQELTNVHISSLAYFLQSIKGINENMSYAEIIQKLNTSEHSQKEFNVNYQIFSIILGLPYSDAENYRSMFLNKQLAILNREVENDIFPETKEELEQRIKDLFLVENEEIAIEIDMNFILSEFDECYDLMRKIAFNLHKYVGKAIQLNYNTIMKMFKEHDIKNMKFIYCPSLENIKCLANYAKDRISLQDKYNSLIEALAYFKQFNPKEIFTKENIIYKKINLGINEKLPDLNIKDNLLTCYGKIIQPVSNMQIIITDEYVKIKTDLSNMSKNIKDKIIAYTTDHFSSTQVKIGEIKIFVKDKQSEVVILIQQKFSDIANNPWMLSFIEKMNYFYNLEAIEKARKIIEDYAKWFKFKKNPKIETPQGKLVELTEDVNKK